MTDGEAGGYRGAIGAFPYAFRVSRSRLLRSYVLVGGLVALLTILLFTASLISLLAATFRTSGGTFTFSRAFVVVVALAVVGPLIAPVLLVARRHRRSGSTLAYDRAMAGGGYAFLFSLYLALLISAPPSLRETPPAVLAPLVETLYALPRVAGLGPPALAAVFVYLLHRRYRPGEAT